MGKVKTKTVKDKTLKQKDKKQKDKKMSKMVYFASIKDGKLQIYRKDK